MPHIQRSALVAYSAEQMFALVDDIPAYPEFLPWCVGAKEMSRVERHVEAELAVAKGPFQHAFQTRNRLTAGRAIEMSLLSGPFSKLAGRWEFLPLSEQACKIALSLDFEFQSRAADMAFRGIMAEILSSQVDAFTKRAAVIYSE